MLREPTKPTSVLRPGRPRRMMKPPKANGDQTFLIVVQPREEMENPMSDRARGDEFAELLRAAGAGDAATLDRVYRTVESELRRLARTLRAHRPADPAMQTTALVDEVFMRLIANCDKVWEDRDTFFRVAYGTMRRVLADHSRRRRPGAFPDGDLPVVPDARSLAPDREAEDGELFAKFADSLRELEQLDADAASVLMLCFFGTVDSEIALTAEELRSFSGTRTPLAEIAAARDRSLTTTHRTLQRALDFLQSRLAAHR